MKKGAAELGVGLFVLLGLACLIYLAVHLGETEILQRGYQVTAIFDNVSGIKEGAAVEVAGVEVGRVESVRVGPDSRAVLVLRLKPWVKLREDAIASIRTKGIIGDKFVKLSPGSGDKPIPPGGRIRETESAVEWEELIAKFIHGKV